MCHGEKVLLGIASFGFVVTFIPLWLGIFAWILLAPEDTKTNAAVGVSCIVMAGLGSFATIGSVFYYLYRVNHDQQLSFEHRAIWTLVLLIMGLVAAPIYWYFYVWREPESEMNSAGSDRDIQRQPPEEKRRSGKVFPTTLIKIALGIASLSGVVASFAFGFSIILAQYYGLMPFVIGFITMIISGFTLTGVIAYYICKVYHHPKLSGEQKIMWTMILLGLAVIAAPAYWYYYIWRESEDESGKT